MTISLIELLDHHVGGNQIILHKHFGDRAPTDDEIRSLVINEVAPKMAAKAFLETTFEAWYPNLQTAAGLDQYIESKTASLIAVRDHQYFAVHDIDPLNQRPNIDWHCRHGGCANREGDTCIFEERSLGLR